MNMEFMKCSKNENSKKFPIGGNNDSIYNNGVKLREGLEWARAAGGDGFSPGTRGGSKSVKRKDGALKER
jgi:hypothetical protein